MNRLREWIERYKKQLFLGGLLAVVSVASITLGYLFSKELPVAAEVPAASVESVVSGQLPSSLLEASVIETVPGPVTAPITNKNNQQTAPVAPKPLPAPPALTATPSTSPAATPKKCSYATTQFPNYEGVILNEIAWMGTPAGANDEWIELKNISGSTVNVSGWQVVDKAEQIHVTLPALSVPTGGFVLLERGEPAVPFKTATALYTGALSNTNEGVRLFDPGCILRDSAIADPDWAAGETSEKRTMERGSNLMWHTYSGSGSSGILGTPGAVNSIPPEPVAQNESTTTPAQENVPPADPTSTLPSQVSEGNLGGQATTTPAVSGLSHIVISEVQITGGAGLTTNDYIEIYNPLSTEFNLKGYRLVKRTKTGVSDTSLKSWTADAIIPAGGHYVWANSGYTTITKTVGAATTGSIADDNGIAIRQGSENTGTIIDAVAWGANESSFIEGSVFPTNPGANEKLRRKQWQDSDNNASDFNIGA